MNMSLFNWLNFIVNAVRLFAKIFGDAEIAKEAQESEERSGDGDNAHAC